MTTISRQELFDAAWDRPLVKVAAEFGVTSTALKKTCRRHHIPTPSRGYWASVEAGAILPKPKLSKVKNPELETIHIYGGTPMPAVAKQALAEAKAALAGKPSASKESAPERQREHPIIAGTRKALNRPKADDNGFVRVSGRGLVQLKIGQASADRAADWLAEIHLQLRQQGGDFQTTDAGAAFLLAGETVPFRIEEKPERTPHVPTKAELARKADRLRWGGYSADPWPKYDHSPSGRLSVVLEANSYTGLRRTFGDGSTQRLETMTPDILAALAAHAALIKERRQEAEAARKAAEIAERKRRRLAAFVEREGRRRAFVDLIADKLEERARLQAVLDHICAGDPAERDRLDGMAVC